MKKTLVSLFILSLSLPLLAVQKPDIEKEIRFVFEVQRKAWNEGNIDDFMAYYWNSEELTFQSGDTRLKGWDALYSRYKETYPGENMGDLEFSDLIIHILSGDAAYVQGRWQLETKSGTKQGLFTVIFKRMEGGWKIVHDHTS